LTTNRNQDPGILVIIFFKKHDYIVKILIWSKIVKQFVVQIILKSILQIGISFCPILSPRIIYEENVLTW
jgi:hypothetical protein